MTRSLANLFKHRLFGMSGRVVIPVALAAALAVAAGSFAFFVNTGGSASAGGQTGILGAPTGVTVPPTSSGTVAVSWTGSTGSVTPQGYYVQRYAGSTPSAACGTSPTSLTSATSCNDTGVTNGTYTYTVTAVYNSWTAASSPSGSVVVNNDTTPPTATITFPGNGATQSATIFNAGCPTTGICGNAADATGVASVKVSILQASSGKYWDGSGFNNISETFNASTLGTPGGTSTTWDYPFSLPPDGSYTVDVQTADTVGNAQTGATYAATSTFTIDTTPPTAAIAFPVNGAFDSASMFNAGCPTTGICGTAADVTGVQTVNVSIQQGAGNWWGGTTFNKPSEFFVAATVTSVGATSTTWKFPFSLPVDGSYTVHVQTADTLGNAQSGATYAATSTFTIDTTPPSGGSVSYTAGYYTTASIGITTTNSTDGGSGVNAASGIIKRDTTSLSAGVCGTFPGTYATTVTLVGGADTSVTTGHCYKYEYLVSDNVGNQATYTSANVAKVDTVNPTDALTLGASRTGAFLSGGTLYYKSDAIGNFTIVDTVTDTDSGPVSATFPAIATTGWTHASQTVSAPPGGPYPSSTFSWTATPSNPTGYTVTSNDNAGNTSAGSSLTFQSDTTAPTGGALSVNGTAATGGGPSSYSTIVGFTLGPRTNYAETPSATQSGLASSTLTVSSFALLNNTCAGTSSGPFATPTTVTGTTQPGTILTGFCYVYTLLGSDNVGNAAFVTTTVMVDTTAPTTPTLAFTGLSSNAFFGSGFNALYFRPAAGGTYTVTASSSDPETGIKAGNAGYTFSDLSGNSFTGTQTVGQDAYTFGASATQPGTAPTVFSTNNAGNASSNASYNVVSDTTAPAGGAVTVNGASTDGSSTTNTSGTYAIAGLAQYTETQSATKSGLASSSLVRDQVALNADGTGTCGTTWTGAVTISANRTENSGVGIASGNCYRYTLKAVDNVGNTASIQIIVKVDTTAPVLALHSPPITGSGSPTTCQFINTSTVYYSTTGTGNTCGSASGSFTVNADASDPESGINKVNFPTVGNLTGGGDVTGASPFSSTYSWTATSTGTANPEAPGMIVGGFGVLAVAVYVV